MKINLKTTNEAENAAATPICHQRGQRTVNGIIGNTRRGIVIDKTLDPDSNNPVSNKPVSTALAALAGKIDAALQKPTGLTKTKLVGVGASGQENIEIGDNLTLANGKLSATGGGSGGQFCIITLNISNNTYTSNIPLPTDGTTPVFVDLPEFDIILPVTYPYKPDSDGSRRISAMNNDGYTFYVVTLKSDGTITYNIFEMLTYTHFITLSSQTLGTIYINLVNFRDWEIDLDDLKVHFAGKSLACSGFVKKDGQRMNATYIKSFNNILVVHYFDTSGEGSLIIDDTFSITDELIPNN